MDPPKRNLRAIAQDLAVFSDSFNERPVHHSQNIPKLYYSEKLLTLVQMQNYEKAISELFDYVRNFDDQSGQKNQ